MNHNNLTYNQVGRLYTFGTLLLMLGLFLSNPNTAFGQKASTEKRTTGLNTLTSKEKSEGWKLLFDGKSTEAL